MTSFGQIEANRRNAQLSTGPVTEEVRGDHGKMPFVMGSRQTP
jgi:hypothetical protein